MTADILSINAQRMCDDFKALRNERLGIVEVAGQEAYVAILDRGDGYQGSAMTPDQAELFGLELIRAATLARERGL